MNLQHHLSVIEKLVPGALSPSEQSFVLSTLESVLHLLSEQAVLIQSLKDEVNRLKGEDGKPTISGKNQKETVVEELSDVANSSFSSESARKVKPTTRPARSVKFDKTRRIDEIERIDLLDRAGLPSDLEFKGYAKSHYQSFEIKSKLIEVQRFIYYSASMKQTYTAPLPSGYAQGSDYTQELKGHVILLKFESGLSIPKIGDFLRIHGVDITNGTISNIILESGELFQAERLCIHQAGLVGGLYSATDTTAARFNGVNYHSHVFGNASYTAYFTKKNKDRQTVLDIIRGEEARTYLLNERTFMLYKYLKIPQKVTALLRPLLSTDGQAIDDNQFITQIKAVLDTEDYEKHEEKLLEGAYIAAYYEQDPLNILVCDDAPQYKLLAALIVLCWVHGGRHFKKLNPRIIYHQDLLAAFLTRFWEFYHKLKDYKEKPDPVRAALLADEFDALFATKTGYQELDDRIDKTRANKQELLQVLKHPYLPLHNNDIELAVRKEVRYRDISFQTRTLKGTQAKDVFFTIFQTCKKLGVNAYLYIMDRITQKYEMTPLAIRVEQKNSPN
jgi:hypothetical protein